MIKEPQPGSNWFFVDESGDANFYDRDGNFIVGQPGCSPVLILGLIETRDPRSMRRAILALREEVSGDPYLQGIPSLAKTAVAFHAKDDAPEVRYRFYKLISCLDFKAQFIVARKIERVFRNSFESNANAFYDHLITHLFKNLLHRHQANYIYAAQRGSRKRQAPLAAAIERGRRQFEDRWKTRVETTSHLLIQHPNTEPCLSVVDYMNWAVHRAYTKREMRYYRFVEDKVSLLLDLYDIDNYPRTHYHRKNAFDIDKTTPL